MSILIKKIPVETRCDQQMSLQVHEVEVTRCDIIVKKENILCVVIEQHLGLDDDALLAVTLSPSQVDKLIGQLFVAKAEIETRNKNLQNS